MSSDNLLEPDATRLPDREQPQAALDSGADPGQVVKEFPDFSEAWAALAERAQENGDVVAAYAYARTGYHRGLDQLRRNGWKGFGPVPWSHRPNQGFLRSVGALAAAANAISEVEEYKRCLTLLMESDPEAPAELGLT